MTKLFHLSAVGAFALFLNATSAQLRFEPA